MPRLYTASSRSIDRNAFSHHISRHGEEEIAGGIVKGESERTTLRAAVVAQRDGLAQVNGSEEVSITVVGPHPVNEFESPRGRLRPRAEADIAAPRVHVGIVDFGPSLVPDLEGFLD